MGKGDARVFILRGWVETRTLLLGLKVYVDAIGQGVWRMNEQV